MRENALRPRGTSHGRCARRRSASAQDHCYSASRQGPSYGVMPLSEKRPAKRAEARLGVGPPRLKLGLGLAAAIGSSLLCSPHLGLRMSRTPAGSRQLP
eukprot:6245824-Amphidinium_carterae.1